ncbi:hypothetical protein COB55_00255 [Candidatus Wolfebacteria bacterium]|nr:MAG: hypothetical protein COB55_00255 [Candidatus Wolfebacteria bacterium]
MKVLMIGSDRLLFQEGSSVRDRLVATATLFDELHIVVFANKTLGLKKQKISNNVWIYPTSSLNRWTYVIGAVAIGSKIIRDWDTNDSVISTQDPFEAGVVGVKLKKKFGIPLQFQVHTDFLSPHFVQGFLNKMRVRIADSIMKYANSVRVVSLRIKDAIIEKYNLDSQSVTVLPIFVDVQSFIQNKTNENFRSRYPEFKSIVLMISRLTHEKNIMEALSILKDVLKTNPETGLLIVGAGPEREILERKARDLGVEDNVRFESWSDNISAYYNTADIFLLTSFFEGYGLTIIEAGAHRIPVVASDVGIVGDGFRDGIELSVCPVGDTECFVEKLNVLISDRDLRMQYAVNFEAVLMEKYTQDFDDYIVDFRDSLLWCISESKSRVF